MRYKLRFRQLRRKSITECVDTWNNLGLVLNKHGSIWRRMCESTAARIVQDRLDHRPQLSRPTCVCSTGNAASTPGPDILGRFRSRMTRSGFRSDFLNI